MLLGLDDSLVAKPNSLARKLNAKTRELRERYGIRYTPHREDNVKYILLELLSDNTDKCDILEAAPGHENTEYIGITAQECAE